MRPSAGAPPARRRRASGKARARRGRDRRRRRRGGNAAWTSSGGRLSGRPLRAEVYAERDSRRIRRTAPAPSAQGTSMKAPTIGQTFGSFGEDVAAQDGHADAAGARRDPAAAAASRAERRAAFIARLSGGSTGASWP